MRARFTSFASVLSLVLASCVCPVVQETSTTGAGAGGAASSGAGGSPPPEPAAICAEVQVVNLDCPSYDYHDPLVSYVAASGLVFRGTVTTLNAVTPGLAVTFDLDYTVIAHVDEVVWQAGSLPFAGADVTVVLLSKPTMPVGYQGYFFAVGAAYGETVAVDEIVHADPGVFPDLEADVPAIVDLLAEEDLAARMVSASSILVGRVTAVSPPFAPAASEHDPEWAAATIETDCVLRGDRPATAEVAFPTSQDLAWSASPKLTVGQEGVFLLQPVALPPWNGHIPTSVPYVVSDARDVHPLSERDHLSTLVRCPPYH
jgi:hypothetical protein